MCSPWWLFDIIIYHAQYRDVGERRVRRPWYHRVAWGFVMLLLYPLIVLLSTSMFSFLRAPEGHECLPSWKETVEEAPCCCKPLCMVWIVFWTALLCLMWFVINFIAIAFMFWGFPFFIMSGCFIRDDVEKE